MSAIFFSTDPMFYRSYSGVDPVVERRPKCSEEKFHAPLKNGLGDKFSPLGLHFFRSKT